MFESLKRFCGSRFITCKSYYPKSTNDILKLKKGKYIPRGEGNSYVEASFSSESTSLNMKNFNKILSFNKSKLSVEVQSGVNLGDLYNFLLKEGYYISIQPGYPYISIGGCIAANVHGKNPHKDGLFQNIVSEIKLFDLKKKKIITLSRKKNSKLFYLTIGGIGLTGIIISAKLLVKKLKSYSIEKKALVVNNFHHGIKLINSEKKKNDMFYVWIDLSGNNLNKSRGLLFTGNFINDKKEKKDLLISKKRLINYKLNFYNFLSLKFINKIFYIKEKSNKIINLSSFLFPAIQNKIYFSLFGSNGLIEQQFIIPFKYIKYFSNKLQILLKIEKPLIVLATIKIFKGNQKYLSFSKDGYCITFDYCNNQKSKEFIGKLYSLISECKGISNIIKDDCIDEEIVSKQYKEKFKNFKKLIFKHNHQTSLNSNLSNKIGIT